jgi:hypothetical protein
MAIMSCLAVSEGKPAERKEMIDCAPPCRFLRKSNGLASAAQVCTTRQAPSVTQIWHSWSIDELHLDHPFAAARTLARKTGTEVLFRKPN